MIENKVVVGISQGDINGIGLEIILKTLLEPELSEICIPVLFSSQKTVSYFRKALNLDEFKFVLLLLIAALVIKFVEIGLVS